MLPPSSAHFSETSVNIQQTAQLHILGDNTAVNTNA
jgi:hypothetical protein